MTRDSERVVKFGTWHPDGTVTNVRHVQQSDIGACPHTIFVAAHYRPDGSCKCDDADERAMMIREWGYEASNFEGPTRGKFTDTTGGVQWDCPSCPAWGLSPNKNAAVEQYAKHQCAGPTREEAKP